MCWWRLANHCEANHSPAWQRGSLRCSDLNKQGRGIVDSVALWLAKAPKYRSINLGCFGRVPLEQVQPNTTSVYHSEKWTQLKGAIKNNCGLQPWYAFGIRLRIHCHCPGFDCILPYSWCQWTKTTTQTAHLYPGSENAKQPSYYPVIQTCLKPVGSSWYGWSSICPTSNRSKTFWPYPTRLSPILLGAPATCSQLTRSPAKAAKEKMLRQRRRAMAKNRRRKRSGRSLPIG